MNVPHLIKAGDNTIGFGQTMSPPKVDCRVWAEDSYQEVLEILKEVRKKDIETYVNGEIPLLPQKMRKRIHDFIAENDSQNTLACTCVAPQHWIKEVDGVSIDYCKKCDGAL